MDSMRLIAYVQCLMMEFDADSRYATLFARLERIETYLIRRVNRGIFKQVKP